MAVCIQPTDQGFAVYQEADDEMPPEGSQTAASVEEALALAQQLLAAPTGVQTPSPAPGADQAAFGEGFAAVRPQ